MKIAGRSSGQTAGRGQYFPARSTSVSRHSLSATVGSRHRPKFREGCQMDVAKLSRGEKIAGVSAVALFIFMFFDWFSVSISDGGGAFASGSVGSGSAWDALDNIPIFLVITIL